MRPHGRMWTAAGCHVTPERRAERGQCLRTRWHSPCASPNRFLVGAPPKHRDQVALKASHQWLLLG